MSTTYTTSAKFILCGDHFVVSGLPSLVIPAPCFEAALTLDEKHGRRGIEVRCRFDVEQTLTGEVQKTCEETLSRLIRHAMPWFGIDESSSGFCFSLKSSIPPSQGAGSSSAVCQAVVGCLLKHFVGLQNVSAQYLFFWSKMLETWLHGEVSGIDNAAVAYGAPICYQKGYAPMAMVFGRPTFFVVASTGPRQPPSPYDVVSGYKTRKSRAFRKDCAHMEDLAPRMVRAFREGNFNAAGLYMILSQATLRDMGLSTGAIEDAITRAMHAGAWGVKMTGAGRGGFVIALSSVEDVDRIQRVWIKAGLHNVRCIQFLPNQG